MKSVFEREYRGIYKYIYKYIFIDIYKNINEMEKSKEVQ